MSSTTTATWSRVYAIAVSILLICASYPVAFWAAETWANPKFAGASTAAVIIPIAFMLGYVALRRLPTPSVEVASVGVDGLMVALALPFVLFLGLAADIRDPILLGCGLLIPPLVWAWLWGTLGFGPARRLVLPVSLTFFALPWEHFFRDTLDRPLQAWTADIALQMLRLAGYPLRYWNEHIIYTKKYYVIVNETCSGMNLLVTLTLYVLVYGWVVRARIVDRFKLFVLVFPLALLANGARVAVIYLLGHYGGVELADGFWHTGSAYVLFLPVFWFIYVVNEALSARSSERRTR